ncbi:MAG TPA: LamG-like jellyroll fold domain-containing protein [Tepidisphaeraceae bacterium]|nr:LamG-like jellyroll fold domain-containing protein [Tepidisphaeraceae bacterium]
MKSRTASRTIEPLESRLLMAVVQVINNNDAGPGSLRQAIADAGSGDTVSLQVTGTISLQDPLIVAKKLTFQGPGENHLTITARAGIHAMDIGSLAPVTINDVRFANGQSGKQGGILRSAGQLTMNRVTFASNRGTTGGGAIYQETGNLWIRYCTFTNNTVAGNYPNVWGGAIAVSSAQVTLQDSALGDNRAEGNRSSTSSVPAPSAYGGAVAVAGASDINFLNNTFSFNYAIGGAHTVTPSWSGSGFGAAIAIASGVTGHIAHCTIVSNQLRYQQEPTGFNGRGAGVFSESDSIWFTNNLIANNLITRINSDGHHLSMTREDLISYYAIHSHGGNYIGVGAEGLAGTVAADHVGTAASPKMVSLDAPRHTGGHVWTRIPTAEVRDLGVTGLTTLDARGAPRVGAPDPGAVELQGDTTAGYGKALWLEPGGVGELFARLRLGMPERAITIEARVNVTGQSTRNVILSSGPTQSNQTITLEYDAAIGAVNFRLADAAGATIANVVAPLALALVQNRWVALHATFDGSVAEVYADGRLIGRGAAQSSGTIGYDLYDPFVTLGGAWTERQFIGGMDDVRIWNVSRDPFGMHLATPRDPHLLAWWNFDDRAEATDMTSAANLADVNTGIALYLASGVRRLSSDAPVRFFFRGWQSDTLTLHGFNPEGTGDLLEYEIVTPPTRGYLTVVSDGSRPYYQHTGDGTGTDTFTYRVRGYTNWSEPMIATIHLLPTPTTPVFATTPPAGRLSPGDSFSYMIEATDVNGDALAFSVAHDLPGWLTLVDNGDGTATLTGTPPEAEWATAVYVQVSDGSWTTEQFVPIQVNRAPAFTTTFLPGATAEQDYAYDVYASDPDFDPLTMTAVSLPAWLTLEEYGYGAWRLIGMPTNANAGDHSVVLRLSDGTSNVDQRVVIPVTPINHAPVFASVAPPPTAYFDAHYTYTLSTTDPDGDPLSITATGLPSWLKLADHGDGGATLSGIPVDSLASSHLITLRVSDGNVVSEQPFVLSVPMERFRLDERGTLIITGGIGRDSIQAWVPNPYQLRTIVNGQTRNFSLSSITAVSVYGLDENDWISVNLRSIPAYVLGGGGNDTIVGGDQRDFFIGGSGHDRLNGGGGDDRLSGLSGNDYLEGGSGHDHLTGGDGHDVLVGNAGNDRLYGDAGNDILYAKDSAYDILHGGEGDDQALYDINDLLHGLFATPA